MRAVSKYSSLSVSNSSRYSHFRVLQPRYRALLHQSLASSPHGQFIPPVHPGRSASLATRQRSRSSLRRVRFHALRLPSPAHLLFPAAMGSRLPSTCRRPPAAVPPRTAVYRRQTLQRRMPAHCARGEQLEYGFVVGHAMNRFTNGKE